MSLRRTAPFLVLLAGAALLAGCASPAEPGESGGSGEPVESSSATPTPTEPEAAAPDPADPGTWVISAAGVGPIELGADRAATVAALPGFVAVDGCPNPNVTFLRAPGLTTADPGLTLARGRDADILVAVAVDIAGPAINGIGVGSTEAEMLAAFPDAERSLRYGSSQQYTIEGSPGWITFQVEPGEAIGTVSIVDGGPPPNEYCG